MATVGRKTCTVNVLKLLARHLEAYITGTAPPMQEQRVHERLEQRVTKVNIPATTIPEIQRLSNAPPTMVANNPTSKQVMQTERRTHQHTTRRNTPGELQNIIRPILISPKIPFHIPRIINEQPPSAKTHKVAQGQDQKTKTAAAKDTPQCLNSLTTTDNHIQF